MRDVRVLRTHGEIRDRNASAGRTPKSYNDDANNDNNTNVRSVLVRTWYERCVQMCPEIWWNFGFSINVQKFITLQDRGGFRYHAPVLAVPRTMCHNRQQRIW